MIVFVSLVCGYAFGAMMAMREHFVFHHEALLRKRMLHCAMMLWASAIYTAYRWIVG